MRGGTRIVFSELASEGLDAGFYVDDIYADVKGVSKKLMKQFIGDDSKSEEDYTAEADLVLRLIDIAV